MVFFYLFEIAKTGNWHKTKQQSYLLCLVTLSTIAITAINPYGLQLWSFLLSTATIPRTDISEWQPLGFCGIFGAYYVFIVFITVLSFIFSSRSKSISLIVIWFLLAYAPQRAYRFLPFFAIATIILASPHLSDCWNRLYDYLKKRTSLYCLFLITITPFLFITIIGLYTQLSGNPGQFVFSIPMPAAAVSLLKQLKNKANVLAEFDWGEYCIWHLGPRIKVAIDGRRETVYSDKVYGVYERFSKADKYWNEILDQYPTDLVLISLNTTVAHLISQKVGWTKVYSDNTCCLFAKEGSPLQKELTQIVSNSHSSLVNTNTFP